MEKLGQFTRSELSDYLKGESLPTDKERQEAFQKVWVHFGKRVALPESKSYNLILQLGTGLVYKTPKKKGKVL